ncbi:MAG: Maf family protein, partial [Parafilimonas sp.]
MPDNKLKIILASQSPRRKQLLEWAEINFDVITSDADESFSTNMPVEEIPIFIARNKAKAVQQKLNSDA